MTCEMNNLEIVFCVQPGCNPWWLSGLKAPANKQICLCAFVHFLACSITLFFWQLDASGVSSSSTQSPDFFRLKCDQVCQVKLNLKKKSPKGSETVVAGGRLA